MSDLSQRFTKRPVTRANARRALDRIERELVALCEHSPCRDHVLKAVAQGSVRVALHDLRRLYGLANPVPEE